MVGTQGHEKVRQSRSATGNQTERRCMNQGTEQTTLPARGHCATSSTAKEGSSSRGIQPHARPQLPGVGQPGNVWIEMSLPSVVVDLALIGPGVVLAEHILPLLLERISHLRVERKLEGDSWCDSASARKRSKLSALHALYRRSQSQTDTRTRPSPTLALAMSTASAAAATAAGKMRGGRPALSTAAAAEAGVE